MLGNIPRCRVAKDETFEQAVGGQPVGAVQPAFAGFSSSIEAGQVGTARQINQYPAASIMLRRHHRNRTGRHIDTKPDQLLIDIREMALHKFRIAVRDIEMDIVEAKPLDLVVVGAGDNVAGSQFHPLRVKAVHITIAGFVTRVIRQFQMPAFAAHRFGDQEIFDLEIIEAGRMELHHLHIRDAGARAPGHGDTVASRAARCGGEQIGSAGAAAGHDRRARSQRLDMAGFIVERVNTPDIFRAGRLFRVAVNDQVDRHHMRSERDIGVGRRGILQRFLHRPAGRVVNMDNPPVAVSAFPREMEDFRLLVERNAHILQPGNRGRGIFHDKFNGFTPVEPSAGNHCVVDMVFERIACIEYRSDSALGPCGRSAGQFTLGQHQHLVGPGQRDRGAQPGGAGPDNNDVVIHAALARVRLRNTSSRSASLVVTSTIAKPRSCIAAITPPALVRSLL